MGIAIVGLSGRLLNLGGNVGITSNMVVGLLWVTYVTMGGESWTNFCIHNKHILLDAQIHNANGLHNDD